MVIAGTHSGVGKTTVATGLMAAFTNRRVRVAPAKVGPDFIDPGYHTVAAGRPGRNLDAWMCGEAAMAPLAAQAAEGADLLIVEGVMGLFDGATGPTPGFASTAHVAKLLGAPVVLVVDAAAMSGSVAALVHGFSTYDPQLAIAGVILNRVGSPGHEALLREALAGVRVYGVLRRDDRLTWRDRHLGLVPVVEDPAAVSASVMRLADAVSAGCDLDGLHLLARAAAPLQALPLPRPERVPGPSVPIAVAGGPAFSFCYPDNLEALEAAGAEVVPIDPLTAPALPDGVKGLVAGGGFPEVYAEHLAANASLLTDVRRRVRGGLTTWAECGGLLWLARSLDGRPMAGAVPADARMTDELTLGYRTATLRRDCPLGPAGTDLRGHEFHYSAASPPGDALELRGRHGAGRAGFAGPTLLASYLHVHLATAPALAASFVRAAST